MSIAKKIKPSSALLRIFFFVAGIVATIAYRVIPFLNTFHVQIAWYTGTIGFILYFTHRTQVEFKRAHLVKDYHLVDIVDKSDIQGEEKSAISYLVKTSFTSKARYNSLFIATVSFLALVASLIFDVSF